VDAKGHRGADPFLGNQVQLLKFVAVDGKVVHVAVVRFVDLSLRVCMAAPAVEVDHSVTQPPHFDLEPIQSPAGRLCNSIVPLVIAEWAAHRYSSLYQVCDDDCFCQFPLPVALHMARTLLVPCLYLNLHDERTRLR
jgi:hypothetical protein